MYYDSAASPTPYNPPVPKIIDANANKSRLANQQTLRYCDDVPRIRLIEINDEHENDQKQPRLLKSSSTKGDYPMIRNLGKPTYSYHLEPGVPLSVQSSY